MGHKDFFLCFILKVLLFYIYICRPFWVNFCMSLDQGLTFFFFFAFGCPTVSIPSVEKSVLSPLDGLYTSIKKQVDHIC